MTSVLTKTRRTSPAANWHANVLGINLDEIVGSGPKGHILKSDILSFEPKVARKQDDRIGGADTSGTVDISIWIEVGATTDLIIQQCIHRITTTNAKVKQVQYKYIPEMGGGYLQLNIKAATEGDGERVKNLLKIYLNDTRHLLL